MNTATRHRRRSPSTFEQADVLRVAAVIKALLGDFHAHPWRDCIELARDFTQGDRRDASDLAWQALTEYLGDVGWKWLGAPGARWLAQAPTPEAALTVGCPQCGAAVGEPCMKLRPAGEHKHWPHEAREDALLIPEPVEAAALTAHGH